MSGRVWWSRNPTSNFTRRIWTSSRRLLQLRLRHVWLREWRFAQPHGRRFSAPAFVVSSQREIASRANLTGQSGPYPMARSQKYLDKQIPTSKSKALCMTHPSMSHRLGGVKMLATARQTESARRFLALATAAAAMFLTSQSVLGADAPVNQGIFGPTWIYGPLYNPPANHP